MDCSRQDKSFLSDTVRRAETRPGITRFDSDSSVDSCAKISWVRRRAVAIVSSSSRLMVENKLGLRSYNWAVMNDMTAPGMFAEDRPSFRAVSKSKKVMASVKVGAPKSPFSTCETATDLPTPGVPRYHRISLSSPEAQFSYPRLSKIGIDSDRFVVSGVRSDLASRRSTRLLLSDGTIDHEVRIKHRCWRTRNAVDLWKKCSVDLRTLILYGYRFVNH